MDDYHLHRVFIPQVKKQLDQHQAKLDEFQALCTALQQEIDALKTHQKQQEVACQKTVKELQVLCTSMQKEFETLKRNQKPKRRRTKRGQQ